MLATCTSTATWSAPWWACSPLAAKACRARGPRQAGRCTCCACCRSARPTRWHAPLPKLTAPRHPRTPCANACWHPWPPCSNGPSNKAMQPWPAPASVLHSTPKAAPPAPCPAPRASATSTPWPPVPGCCAWPKVWATCWRKPPPCSLPVARPCGPTPRPTCAPRCPRWYRPRSRCRTTC
ncbi:hypothetical protein D3C71_1028750 [compost metagenome]